MEPIRKVTKGDAAVRLGIVVLGHGSRADAGDGNQVAFEVAALVRERVGHDRVEAAILTRRSERQTIEEAVCKLIGKGAQQITVAPMFFARGMHISQDIPESIDALRQKYPDVEFRIASPIGADSRIADVLIDRIREAE